MYSAPHIIPDAITSSFDDFEPALVEPNSYPYPAGVEKPNYGVRFHFLMGNVYKMEPMKTFGTLRPGKSKFVRYISEHSNVALTDVHPNWYIVGPYLEPRVIDNTRGDSLDFVAPYKTPAMWKRNTNLEDPEFDILNPFTASKRYREQGVEDLGAAPHLVIPTPLNIQTYNKQTAVNVLTNSWVIMASPRLAKEGKYLSDVWSMNMVLKAQDSHYVQLIEEAVELTARGRTLPTEETYELRVSPTNNIITIKASHPAGAFYAIQTLLSLTDKEGNIPETVITDGPRYRYRGVLLDVARNFQSKEKIFRYLDVMAMYKLNKLHFHLTDDEGWRLTIPGLEELTEVGATRCHDPTETKCLLPFLGSGPFSGPPGTGHYSVDDYRDILRYATTRHIEVIPEIDMPGHSHAAIKSMLARFKKLESLNMTEATRYLLNDLQDESDYLSVQSFADDAMNPCLRSTYTFISRVINALYAMHRDISPLRMFHFGGDEVPSGTWQKSPVCERLKMSGVATDLKTYMVSQIANMTSLYDLDLAAWEDGIMIEGKPMKRENFPNKLEPVWHLRLSNRCSTPSRPQLLKELVNDTYKCVTWASGTQVLKY
ncbi:hypothetical protein Btru_005047 [Bulinus truncatus]|nr:hypothetical protein Btru_005047 [Bulinus truncatus]